MGAIIAIYVLEEVTGPFDGGAIQPRAIAHGQYWRLLTAMFLHGGLLHIVVNLIALFQLGRLYEAMFGTRRFVFIYFVTGLAASITSWQRLPDWGASVGASGAIFGVLGAFVFSIRRSPRWRHEKWAHNLVAQIIFWIVANIVISLRIPQIDVAAHIGGLVAGLILGALLPHRVPPPPPSRTVVDVQPYEG
jgi:rhomboid protease GluP